MDGGYDAAGVCVEFVFGLGVADSADDFACRFLDVHVGVVGTHLAADYHESCGAEGFARNFRLRVLPEKFIKDGI